MILDGDAHGRKQLGEFFGHIWVFNRLFEVVDYLPCELAGSINPAAPGFLDETVGNPVVEVGAPLATVADPNPYTDTYTR